MQKKEFVSGVFFTAAAKYSNIIVSLIISAILARLLTPEDFGVITIATVILSFFAIISDLGIAPAIVQNKELTKRDLNQIFSFAGYLGIFVSSLFFLSSSLIAKFYDVDSLINICRFLSINLLFSSLNIVPNALLLKAKRFKFIAIRTVSVQITLGIVAVIAAYSGVGMYALLIAPIGSSILIFIINYLQNPLSFHPKIEMVSISKISSYSIYQFLFSAINYFSRNLDNLLIGKYIGVTSLGYYDKSYRLMMLPLSNITHVITPVLHPLLSEHQNDRKYIYRSYIKLLKLLAYIGFPLSVFLHFQASNLILLIFGDQWGSSIPIFKILALSVAPQILSSTLGSIFQSTNETKRLFFIGNINTTVNITAIVSAIIFFGSIEGVAMFISTTFYMNLIVSFTYLFRTVFSESMALFAKTLLRPIFIAICLVPLCYYVSNWIDNQLLSICVASLASLIITLIFVHLNGDYDIVSIIRKVLKLNI